MSGGAHCKIEELVNKWSHELQDHERMLLEQADLVNQWDFILQRNGEIITSLNEEVDRIDKEQKRLDNELDFIYTQQNELEEVLSKLEGSLPTLPHTPSFHYADAEGDHTYSLMKQIDSQLLRKKRII